MQDTEDCESIQFISGMALRRRPSAAPPNEEAAGDVLTLSLGVNDCEARLGSVALERVWRMLIPLPGEKDACQPDA